MMMRYMRLGILLVILIVTGSLLVTAQDGERLNNPGLEEGSFGPYTTRRGGEFPIYLPPSWNVWLAASTGEFLNRGERTTINPHPGPGPDPRQGTRALSIDCGFVTCTVAIYQQVPVSPDNNIQASAWAQVKACNPAPNAESCGSAVESGSQTRIGIDPNGGTDPNDSDIVWSGFVQPHDRWEQMSVSATTTGTTATLFLYSTQANTANINKTYWDQVSLTGGGQGGSAATNVPPTPTPIPEVPFVVPQNERPDGSIVHTVRSGDTLDSIAYAYQTSRADLLELNPAIRGNGGYLQIGQEVLVRPAQEQQPTATPETVEPPAETTPETAPPEDSAPVEVSSPSINPGGDLLASIV
ncbi:MAG: LysM peptidoglycan-binding domain-containing protein, partial [Anaerolineae bacterium]|nr:LysM peptidoglycan-binding domain-containing protein [Anaerolineae bacterium]